MNLKLLKSSDGKFILFKNNNGMSVMNTEDNWLLFRFSDNINPTSISNGGEWVKVDSEFNDWKWICNETSWKNKFNHVITSTFDSAATIIDASMQNVVDTTGLFRDCTGLISVVLNKTNKLTNTTNMFRDCINLSTINAFDTSNVTIMSRMFMDCHNLREMVEFNTSNTILMDYTFNGCRYLKKIPMLNTSKVTNMEAIFADCVNLNDIPQFDTGNVTNMNSMFYNCYNLVDIPLFDTKNVTTMYAMFQNCYCIKTVPLFNTVNVKDMSYMFYDCSDLKTVPKFNTKNVQLMVYMFYFGNMTTLPAFDLSSCYDISYMCKQCDQLKEIPNFNPVKITRLVEAFANAQSVSSGMVRLYNNVRNNGVFKIYRYDSPDEDNNAYDAFYNCGINNEAGIAERAQISPWWGGTGPFTQEDVDWYYNFFIPRHDTTSISVDDLDEETKEAMINYNNTRYGSNPDAGEPSIGLLDDML